MSTLLCIIFYLSFGRLLDGGVALAAIIVAKATPPFVDSSV
jgi:hypothetical protein